MLAEVVLVFFMDTTQFSRFLLNYMQAVFKNLPDIKTLSILKYILIQT